MKDQELLQKYIDFIPFLAQVCGSGCEIVIHDIRNRENSIVAIENNISKRKIGDPLTDLACELADNNTYKQSDFLVNYSGTSKGRSFISSTYFIKNNDFIFWSHL